MPKLISRVLVSLCILASSEIIPLATPVQAIEQSDGQSLKNQAFVFEVKPYVQIPLQEQIRRYRSIYDSLNFEPNNFKTLHIPELFEILENGFALVADYMSKKQPYAEQDTDEARLLTQEKVINDLNKLYKIAHSLNDSGQMTQANFLSLNLALAYTADVYKMKTDGGLIANMSYRMMGEIFKEFPDNIHERIFDLLISQWPSDLQKATVKVNSFLPLVIYTDHGYGIAPDTFVDQYLNYINPGAILFFDVSSKVFVAKYTPEQRERLNQARESKKLQSNIDIKQRELSGGRTKVGTNKGSPHFSEYDGTLPMLWHDSLHYKDSTPSSYFYDQVYPEFEQDLLNINSLRLSFDRQDPKYIILTLGLFIFSHEFSDVFKSYDPAGNMTELVNAIHRNIRGMIQKHLDKRNIVPVYNDNGKPITESYRYEGKDLEALIKFRRGAPVLGLDGTPYIPVNFKKLSPRQKQETVMVAYDRFWQDFLTIIYGSAP